jgi:prepilin-type N-terminal cleavage/methylation domain-containing protein
MRGITMRTIHRRGLTLLEVLVVIVILGLLVGLMLPNLDENRGQSRQRQCQNNIRNLAYAALHRATKGSKGEFPGYLQAQRLVDTAPWPDEFPQESHKQVALAWPAMLLPELDEQAAWASLLEGSLDPADPPRIDVFVCPSDVQTNATAAALSYVANSGAPDVAPTATTGSDSKANGVCHNLLPNADGPRVRTHDIKDGANATILFAENFQRDQPSAGAVGNTWLRPASIATNVEQWFGMVWVYDEASPMSPQPEIQERINQDTRSGVDLSKPYGDFDARFARPASNHVGMFVVAFCAGNVRMVKEDIDYRVYQQLMTPNGSKCEWTPDPSKMLPPAFLNADPALKLTDSDLD